MTNIQKKRIQKLARDSVNSKLVKGKEICKMTSDEVDRIINNLTEEEQDYYFTLSIGENS